MYMWCITYWRSQCSYGKLNTLLKNTSNILKKQSISLNESVFSWLHVKHCIDWKEFLSEHNNPSQPLYSDRCALKRYPRIPLQPSPEPRGDRMIRALLSRNILPTHERIQKVIMFECRFLKKHAFHASLSLVGPPDKQYSITSAVGNLPSFKIPFYHSFVLRLTVF